MPDPRIAIPGSQKTEPPGKRLGALDPDDQVEVSVYLKDERPGAGASREACRSARSKRLTPLMEDLARFAAEHGLRVTRREPARRLVKLVGPVGKLETAFGTKLEAYEHNGCRFRARTGPLTMPRTMSDRIEAVLGLDNRPAANSKMVFPRNATAVGFASPQDRRFL